MRPCSTAASISSSPSLSSATSLPPLQVRVAAAMLRRQADRDTPSDVLDAVGIGEAQVLAEPMADIVAIEQIGDMALRLELLLDEIGDRRLAGARQAGEPQDAGLLAGVLGAGGLADVERLPMDVGSPPERKVNEPHAHRIVGEAVDDDEAAELAVIRIRSKSDGAIEIDVANADLVQA